MYVAAGKIQSLSLIIWINSCQVSNISQNIFTPDLFIYKKPQNRTEFDNIFVGIKVDLCIRVPLSLFMRTVERN